MRSLAALLTLCLLIGALPAASLAAEPPASPRGLEDAIRLGLTSDAWLIDSEQITGSISDAVAESQRRAIAEFKLNAAKAAQRDLGRLYRTARREASGPDRACERAVIDLMYQQEHARYQALIVAHRAELGYVDRQKGITKLSRFLGSVAKQTVKRAGPELIAAAVSGGLGGGVARAIFKRHLVRVAKGRGQDRLARALVRQAQGPIDVALAQALKACQPGAEETTEATPVPSATPTPDPGSQGSTGTTAGSTYVCDLDCEHCADLPPYDEPAFLIHVDWSDQEDVLLNYWAAPPGSDPYGGADWMGGCIDGPLPRHCHPVEPLILTQAYAGGKNLWYYPGALELIVAAHPCVFANDIPEKPGDEGPRHLDVCARISEVDVTATIEYYAKGAVAPQPVGPPLKATVPLYPCEDAPDPAPYRRTLETFHWDPATGITSSPVTDGGEEEDAPWDRDDS